MFGIGSACFWSFGGVPMDWAAPGPNFLGVAVAALALLGLIAFCFFGQSDENRRRAVGSRRQRPFVNGWQVASQVRPLRESYRAAHDNS